VALLPACRFFCRIDHSPLQVNKRLNSTAVIIGRSWSLAMKRTTEQVAIARQPGFPVEENIILKTDADAATIAMATLFMGN
jgi:hypothetical protein